VKSRIVAGAVLFLAILLLLSAPTTAKNESSCVSCHTDDATLKRLCKVPEIPTGEAEG
jgi:cytochrome c